jgi:hypothetical protein
VQHPAQVDVDHRRPPVSVKIGHGSDLADAGVAHQHVEPAELLDRQSDESVEVLASSDVSSASEGTATALADVPGDLVETLGSTCAKDDSRATRAS